MRINKVCSLMLLLLFLIEVSFAQDGTFFKGVGTAYKFRAVYHDSSVYVSLDGKISRIGFDGKWLFTKSGFDPSLVMAPCNSGGLILLDDSLRLTRINSLGDIVWARILEQPAGRFPVITETFDQNFLIAVNRSDSVSFIKTDQNGTIQWIKVYYCGTAGKGRYLTKSTDDCFLSIMGNYLFKLNHSGELIWSKANVNQAAVVSLPDSGMILIGNSSTYKIDRDGKIIWSKLIVYPLSGAIIKDDEIILSTNSSIICLNNNGGTKWQTVQENSLLLLGEDRGYLFCLSPFTTYQYNSLYQISLAKTDSMGNYKGIVIKDLLPKRPIGYGQKLRIEWLSNKALKISILQRFDNENWSILENSVTNSKSYEIMVPDKPGHYWQLKIEDAENTDFFAVTRNFYLNFSPLYDIIRANKVILWIGANGESAHDPVNDAAGLLWPRNPNGYSIPSIYYDGLVWGGNINGKLHVCGSTFRTGLNPGRNPFDTSAGIWKLRRNWETTPDARELEKFRWNYDNWPGEQGAPFKDINQNGKYDRGVDLPRIMGDETLWFSANDFDTTTARWIYGSDPIGMEMQSTIYAYDRNDELADVVFKKYKLINKNINDIMDMYIAQWSDPDLGDCNDDFVGVDTVLNMGYCYNGDNNDANYYGLNPPAVGYKIVQGPVTEAPGDSALYNEHIVLDKKNLPISAFHCYEGGSSTWADPTLGSSDGADQIYRQMQGKFWDGKDVIDVHTGKITRFCLAGDPVAGIGWYEGAGWPRGPSPQDRRFLISSGPFNLAAGDTQEVVIAFIAARGTDNINSISELKRKARVVQEFYNKEILTGVEEIRTTPVEYSLYQNFPNPFNPSTMIRYSIASDSKVILKVFDILGKEVVTLVNEDMKAGKYEVVFKGSTLSSGVYYYQLRAGDYVKVKKMMLIK